VAFSYEDKQLPQHWTMYNWSIHWPVVCMTQNMHICRRQTL